MFKKKKEYPEGTFIPTSKRLLAIMQLCFAFSLICWYGAQPFMGEYFALKSKILLYEYVLGVPNGFKPDIEKKLKRNVERFTLLAADQQQLIRGDYQKLQAQASRSTSTKIVQGLHAVLFEIPPFELAWIFFSILTAILLLLKVEGASSASWLLPIIVLAYGVDNQLNGYSSLPDSDNSLFPTEAFIVQNYLQEPLSDHWDKQREQLTKGWERYLAHEWSGLDETKQKTDEGIEQGEFNFTIARLQRLHNDLLLPPFSSFHLKISPFFLSLYVLWNLFFAWMINRSHQNKGVLRPISLRY